MIAYLEGKILSTGEQHVVVGVHGVGYRVFVLQSFLFQAKIGNDVVLQTHQYVREDSLELYGFERQEELVTFEVLIGITGVGPKTALGILSITTPEQLRTAVASGNVGLLTKVSGVGKKTAERLIVELKDTFAIEEKKKGAEAGQLYEQDVEVIEALEQLGYGRGEARKAIEQLPKDIIDTETRLKTALKHLGKK